ncbi:MAG: ATP-binding protein, partial [Bacteroidota bacterium]
NLQKIGDPFFTTKDPDKGTGLGLYITFDILKAYNILYEINSDEGEGTTVTLILLSTNKE